MVSRMLIYFAHRLLVMAQPSWLQMPYILCSEYRHLVLHLTQVSPLFKFTNDASWQF